MEAANSCHPDPALDELLGAISHEVRRAILERLRTGEATAGQLAEPHEMSLPAISRHLRVLEEARLIERRVEGREHHLRLIPETLRHLDDWLAHYRWFWSGQLDALARHLEAEPQKRRTHRAHRPARRPSSRRG